LNAKVNEDSKTKGNKVCKPNQIVKIAKSEKFFRHNSKLVYLTQSTWQVFQPLRNLKFTVFNNRSHLDKLSERFS